MDDRTGPEDEGPRSGEGDSTERPFGTKPFGTKPFGTKPYGTKPFGTKPFGTKPFGTKPFGTKPFGTKPFGTKPFGTKPFDMGWDGGPLDAELWSADLSQLVRERSAVIRLGATVVSDGYELRVAAFDATPGAPDYIEEGTEKPRLKARDELRLRPRDHELAAKMVLSNRLARDVQEDATLAEALKEDLAEALALRADRAFLHGDPPPPPRVQPIGISNRVPLNPALPAAGDLLATVRNMVTAVRTLDPLVNPVFRAPGWVLHPATLDALTRLQTADGLTVGPGRSLDSFGTLLSLDGSDGGMLLGYPFVVSAAAFDGMVGRIYFSADWREAWIGADGDLVTVDISSDSHFQTDETVIRATMSHDFTLRRPEVFTWVNV